jgi:undecaprenyl phosphate-alpha-L-ara4FN deformylase
MPQLTLKVDVDTFRGTREGVPNLVRLFQAHQTNATFLFSMGPDHTGWALRRAFRPGFFSKVARTSVLEHYGLKTLMYGVFLPAPDIGVTCVAPMRAVRDAGFECGVHTWDHVVWQDSVRFRDAAWTQAFMSKSVERFQSVFGRAPSTHGAAGWQMNDDAFLVLDALNLKYASDGRADLREDGTLANPNAGPYHLKIGGRTLNCLQLPTTLPTLDELLGRTLGQQLIDTSNAADALLELTREPRDHVFTLHAELEGQKLAPILEQLLRGWKAQGYKLGSMAEYFETLRSKWHPVAVSRWGSVPGRSGELILQPSF